MEGDRHDEDDQDDMMDVDDIHVDVIGGVPDEDEWMWDDEMEQYYNTHNVCPLIQYRYPDI